MDLRSFVYGREDVLGGKRGYNVFLKSPGFPYNIVKQILNIFSTEDPGAFILRQIDEFFICFPLRGEDEWIFGKGTVERRGKYFSYILHGVLLNDRERRQLSYNPFLLSKQLNPRIGENRQELQSVRMPATKDAYNAIVFKSFNEIPEKNRWRLVRAAGMFVSGRMKPSLKPVFPYHKELEGSFWTLVFSLIPEETRKQTCICTFAQFLKGTVKNDLEIRGILDPNGEDELEKRGHYAVYSEQPNRLEQTTVGDFLWDFLQPGKASEGEKKEKLKFYEDVITHANDSQTLEAILETVKTPSIASLRRLKHWPVHMDEWKAKHFQAVWERNQFDMNPIDFFYEMGSDFFNHFSGSRNKYEEFITKLLNRLLTNGDNRIEAFFDEIARSPKKEMIKPLLYILYHKVAFYGLKSQKKADQKLSHQNKKAFTALSGSSVNVVTVTAYTKKQ